MFVFFWLIPDLFVLLGLGAVGKVALPQRWLASINLDAVSYHVLPGMHNAMRESLVNKHTYATRRMFVARLRPRFRARLPTPSFIREVGVAISMRLAKATEEDLYVWPYGALERPP